MSLRKIALSLVCLLSFQASAVSNTDQFILGAWRANEALGSHYTLEFEKSGKFSLSFNNAVSEEGRWRTTNGDTLVVQISVPQGVPTQTCKINLQNVMLTVSGCIYQGRYARIR